LELELKKLGSRFGAKKIGSKFGAGAEKDRLEIWSWS
jgi:hypothetical protein